MSLRRSLAALVLASALAARVAHAQAAVSDGDKAAARQLTLDGYSALSQRDFAAAADKFARADTLFHAPTVTLGLARARVGLGKLVSAQELYNRLVRETLAPDASAAFTKAVEDGRTELAALAPRIPSLIIQVSGADAPTITLDGVAVPVALLGVKRPVDPGQHVLRGVARRSAPGETTVTVAEGHVETVTLDLVPLPAGAADNAVVLAPAGPGADTRGAGAGGGPLKAIGIAAIGVGGAGLIVGAVTAGLAASKRSSLLVHCPTGHCAPSQEGALGGDVDSLHTLATVSTAGFIGGGVLAAAGVVLLIAAPKARPQAAGWMPLVGPGFVGAQGRF